jgi:hypothetical protein
VRDTGPRTGRERPARPRDEDETDGPKPSKSKRKSGTTGPRPKPRRRDDEDEEVEDDDRAPPRFASQRTGQTLGCIIRVLLALGGAAGYTLWKLSPDEPPARPAAPVPVPAVGGPGSPNDPEASGARLPALAPPFEADPLLERSGWPVHLADLSEFGAVAGPWPFTKGGLGNPTRDPIRVKGTIAAKGLSMHPNDRHTTRAAFAIGGRASALRGSVALNDSQPDASDPVIFQVVGDGKELWRSRPIKRATGPEVFRVNVRGVKVLEVRATTQGAHWGAHAVWVDPALEK